MNLTRAPRSASSSTTEACEIPTDASSSNGFTMSGNRSSDGRSGFSPGRNSANAGTRMPWRVDRKSTRLNSSHSQTSYAAFCLKKKLPDGEWSFTDWIDDDGIDFGTPIPLTVALKKHGDQMTADWTGTSPQVKGAINNTLSFTRAATYTCLKSVLPHEILCNAGFYRSIEVIAPPGTIANAVPPAACAARGLTGFRMVDTVFGALAQMLPDRVIAASEGGNTGVSIGGYNP